MKKYLYKGQIVTASSKEEAKVIADSKYTVWVGGTEVTDKKLTKSEADKLAKKYEKDGYDDVVVEEVTASTKIKKGDRVTWNDPDTKSNTGKGIVYKVWKISDEDAWIYDENSDGRDAIQVLPSELTKVVANKETDEALAEFVLVPTSAIVNKSWLLRFKKMYILDETRVAIQNKLKAPKKTTSLPRMIKYITEE